MEVNLRGPAAFTHAVLPGMLARQRGTIISIGSRNAIVSRPYSTAYSAPKAALLRFHHNLDLETRDRNVYNYVVQPGNVPTTIAHGEGTINLTTPARVPGF